MSEAFQKFRTGRKITKAAMNLSSGDLIPWLHKMSTRSTAWRENSILAPFADHASFYVDYSTKPGTRVVIFQPYLEAVAREVGLVLSLDLKTALLERNRFNHRFPDTSPIKMGVEAVVRVAQRKSDEFAAQHGLIARVSFPGWYSAERVLLIEYTKAVNESASGVAD